MALITGTVWAQQEGVMPWTNARATWGGWAANDVPWHALVVQTDGARSSAEYRAPLRSSSCWSYRLATANVSGLWATSHLSASHEMALAPAWTARVALGAVREAWPELGRVEWSPEWAAALHHTTPDFTAGAWFHGQYHSPERFTRAAGAYLAARWADWAATLTTSPFEGMAFRFLPSGWAAHLGWTATTWSIGLNWSPGSNLNTGLTCGQPPWGRPQWTGYALWQ